MLESVCCLSLVAPRASSSPRCVDTLAVPRGRWLGPAPSAAALSTRRTRLGVMTRAHEAPEAQASAYEVRWATESMLSQRAAACALGAAPAAFPARAAVRLGCALPAAWTSVARCIEADELLSRRMLTRVPHPQNIRRLAALGAQEVLTRLHRVVNDEGEVVAEERAHAEEMARKLSEAHDAEEAAWAQVDCAQQRRRLSEGDDISMQAMMLDELCNADAALCLEAAEAEAAAWARVDAATATQPKR